jgi:hypothetical protein
MKIDRSIRIILGIVSILLLLNFVNSLISSKSAQAISGSEEKGRYQIAAWGVQAQNSEPRSGYYVIDTVTGMLMASKTEVHPLR